MVSCLTDYQAVVCGTTADSALAELEPEFDAQWRGFDTSEQKTMRAVIASAGRPCTADVLRRLQLTKDVVRKACPSKGDSRIESSDDRLVAVDPLFAEWIERLNRGPLAEEEPTA